MTLADEIRALKTDSQSSYGQGIDEGLARAAALAEAHESALVAQLQDPVAVHATMLRGTIAKPTWEQIKHLYHADAQADLDRIKAEAHRAGMREAAEIAATIHEAQRKKSMIGQANGAEKCRVAISAAAKKETGK